MREGWLKIYTSSEYYKAEIVRQVLAENEIEAVLMNKQDSLYRFGEVEVYIKKADFDNALEIIIKNEL